MQISVPRVEKLRMHTSWLKKEELAVNWVWTYSENWGYLHLRSQLLSIDPDLTC